MNGKSVFPVRVYLYAMLMYLIRELVVCMFMFMIWKLFIQLSCWQSSVTVSLSIGPKMLTLWFSFYIFFSLLACFTPWARCDYFVFCLLHSITDVTPSSMVQQLHFLILNQSLKFGFIGGADWDLMSRLGEACLGTIFVIHLRHSTLWKCAYLEL